MAREIKKPKRGPECPACKGKGCQHCNGKGFMSRYEQKQYESRKG